MGLSRAEGCWTFDARDRMPRSSPATALHLEEIAPTATRAPLPRAGSFSGATLPLARPLTKDRNPSGSCRLQKTSLSAPYIASRNEGFRESACLAAAFSRLRNVWRRTHAGPLSGWCDRRPLSGQRQLRTRRRRWLERRWRPRLPLALPGASAAPSPRSLCAPPPGWGPARGARPK
jgi:hypothetical protein